MKRLQGRVAVITGGANGIGEVTAHRFAKEGARVVIADVVADTGEAVAAAIREAGGEAIFVETDVTDLASCEALMARAAEAFGKVEILINNAGITRDATLKKMTEAQFDAVISVNLKGVFNCTKAALPHLSEAGYGRVINTSSVVAHEGNFGQTNYVASKCGVIGMAEVWARELGRKGITVNAVAPGFIETEMVKTVPAKVIDGLTGRTPLGRLGQPEEIASAYVFLASEEAAFITGTTLRVDGGLNL